MGLYRKDIKVGLLGGGQLARMLAQSALNLGLRPFVLSANPEDPAAQATGYWVQGDVNDYADVSRFLKKVQFATFESEFLDPKLLIRAQKSAKIRISPAPEIMAELQDRFSQKSWFDHQKIPTSPWKNIENEGDLLDVHDKWEFPYVFKKRRFGYDGYGTFIIKNQKDMDQFFKNHFAIETFIAEKFIPFKRELAIILCRSGNGDFTYLPLVESKQKDAKCFWVKGPVESPKINSMISKFKKFLNTLNYVGTMGVEFFDTGKELLVNEIAPRVHNTGHYSIDTNGPSQFDLHWKALLGQKFPRHFPLEEGFAMVNLLSVGHDQRKLYATNDTWMHWYGKKEHRKGRKMGHVNALGKTPELALKKALGVEKRNKV